MNAAKISVRNLSMNYGRLVVMHDLSLIHI